MKDFIRKFELWIFLVLGPLVNVVYVYARYLDIVPKAIYNNGRFLLLLFLLICIVAYTRGTKGAKDIFKPMTNWKVNPKWYVFSLLFAFTLGLITLLLKGIYSEEDYTQFVNKF